MRRSEISACFGAFVLLAAASACGDSGGPASQSGDLADGGAANGLGAEGGVSGTGGTGTATGGTGTGTGGTGTATGGTGTGGDFVDPTGVWWTEIETEGSQDLPTVGLLEGSKIRFVMRVVIEGSVPNQTASFEFCDLQTEWASDILPDDVHVIGFRPEAAAAFGETRSVDFSGLRVGDTVPIPDLTFIGGGDETGAIIDEDGDGYPAITAYVRVILPFEVAEVITINASLDVVGENEDTLTGTLDFDVAADIIDSSSAVFVPPDFDVTITPDSDAVPITIRRLPGGGGCSAIPSTLEFRDVPAPPGPPTDPLLGPTPTPTP